MTPSPTRLRPSHSSLTVASQRGASMGFVVVVVALLVGLVALGVYLVRLDGIVRERFEGKRWDIPAKVYARPLELYLAADVGLNDVTQELKLLNYRRAEHYKNSGTYTLQNNELYIHTRGFDFGESNEPERVIAIRFNDNQNNIAAIRTTQLSTNGILRLEPLLIGGIYPQHNEDRVLIKLSGVPQPLIDALIATEDRNFYQHYGVSIRGLARAVISNITGGKRQGGSTLTQQLVKNFYLTPERTYKRKANEALMAVLLELHYTKNEILEAYLNEVNLGQNGNYSVNGYGLAAQFYFGVPLNELNVAQQAFLVGLVNGPSYYNPWKNPDRALARRNVVLNNMRLTGKLTDREYQKEVKRPLGILKTPGLSAVRFPDFMDIVRRQLRQDYAENDLTNQGLRIFTTLDPLAQTRIQTSVDNSIARLVAQNPRRLTGLQGAVIISHPENGEIVAAIGSTSNFTGFNRILDAKRQVGSLLKPVIYMQALQSGHYHWASQIDDTAIEIKGSGIRSWSPKNYRGGEHGTTDLRMALAHSYNLAAVRLGWEAGLPTFVNNLRRLGVTSDIPPYPSILLGAVNLSPMEVLSIYQNFATGGFYYPIRSIRSVVDSRGQPLIRNSQSLQPQVSIEPGTAYLVNYGLQNVVANGTGQAASAAFPQLKLAGKSGTTNDERDSWFAGYSGNYLAVVWLGQDNNRAIGLTGSSGALPVWINAMRQLRNIPNSIAQPGNVQWQWIDSKQNLLSAERCSGAVYIPMLVYSVPRQATACGLPYYQVQQSANDYGDHAAGDTNFGGSHVDNTPSDRAPPPDASSTPSQTPTYRDYRPPQSPVIEEAPNPSDSASPNALPTKVIAGGSFRQ